ncbi:MAG: 4Fe-4S ferredoxin [Candidatus Omnitrophota bacterium]
MGTAPQGAITIEEREAVGYDEKKVMENIIPQGINVVIAHLMHLKDHGEEDMVLDALSVLESKGIELPSGWDHAHTGHDGSGCPGSKAMKLSVRKSGPGDGAKQSLSADSRLLNWPVQIRLIPPNAPYLNGADILISADCVPFAYADFHARLLEGKVLLVGCPKLDDIDFYREKLTGILKNNDVRSLTYAHMEVPCCHGFLPAMEEAVKRSGKDIPLNNITVSIKGEILK